MKLGDTQHLARLRVQSTNGAASRPTAAVHAAPARLIPAHWPQCGNWLWSGALRSPCRSGRRWPSSVRLAAAPCLAHRARVAHDPWFGPGAGRSDMESMDGALQDERAVLRGAARFLRFKITSGFDAFATVHNVVVT